MPDPEEYTVGWICAVTTEFVAAQTFLDEQHGRPDNLSRGDDNDYALGRIARHNVVIAVLPEGEYGLSSAATVAKDMMRSFPNVRVGLMVGIAGGAPTVDHDIRLGDVVVSEPKRGEGGVIQYDLGKTIQGHGFHRSGVLNQPPKAIRTAMSGLKTQHVINGHGFDEAISEVIGKRPKLRKRYSRPSPNADKLYKSSFVHPNQASCETVCATDDSNLVERPERKEDEDNPAIHYGLIASGNQLMKDALVRDRLAQEEGILCFEMEAAGLMNHFPCLVVRGICDYSDSHKNDQWQGYAAMVAAAYAKALLNHMRPAAVETERKVRDPLPDLFGTLKEHEDLTKQTLHLQQDLSEEALAKEARECHQLFRLTTDTRDATYEWYKDRIEERVADTCLWFLRHESFEEWKKQESGCLLVSADPGCGKSVLAKYLVDHVLPRSSTICYFFFKDQDQNTVRQALCAILHQLFSHQPTLLHHAVSQYRKDGKNMIGISRSLWDIFLTATNDSEAKPVVVILDALDECAELEFEDLMQKLDMGVGEPHTRRRKIKFLFTSRPYYAIISQFGRLLNDISTLHIPGEEESDAISEEVSRVITHKVNQLAKNRGLSAQMRTHIEQRLQETTHRTYLWIHLVFDYLEKELFKRTRAGFDLAISSSPTSVDQAYDQILSKSKNSPMVLKVLKMILAAYRPLTLSELNVAVNVDESMKYTTDLDLEMENDFRLRVRSWCGLFVSIHHEKVYLLHQSAREFLLKNLPPSRPKPDIMHLTWRDSIDEREAHRAIGTACVLYLKLLEPGEDRMLLHTGAHGRSLHTNVRSPCNERKESGPKETIPNEALDQYSVENWGSHIREAALDKSDKFIAHVLGIAQNRSRSFYRWFDYFWTNTKTGVDPKHLSELAVASRFGHESIVEVLLEKNADHSLKNLEKDPQIGSPLLWAAYNNHVAVAELLLQAGAEVDYGGYEPTGPLFQAARRGNAEVAKLLLQYGAQVNARKEYHMTPLLDAVCYTDASTLLGSQLEMIILLVHAGAEIDVTDRKTGRTPLRWAVDFNIVETAELLIDLGANVNAKDDDQRTPLWQAVDKHHYDIANILLRAGADVNAEDAHHQTPLSRAAQSTDKMELMAEMLLHAGADPNIADKKGRTPLSYASQMEMNDTMAPLLLAGADVNAADIHDRTPLFYAAQESNGFAAMELLRAGAEFNPADTHQRNVFLHAAIDDADLVEQLLKAGADVDTKDKLGDTPLMGAIDRGNEDVVKVLLNGGANVNEKDEHGRTQLSRAMEKGQDKIVRLLLDAGAELEESG